MKKTVKIIFHFLSSAYFAIFLLSVTSLAVILGTWLESYSQSHLFAAHWLYNNDFFLSLLSLFFINILFSALSRWPFKKRHIPFLVTHLGLLMVLTGTMIKNQFGIQGQMAIMEGSGSHTLFFPHSYALHIEKHDTSNLAVNDEIKHLPPKTNWRGNNSLGVNWNIVGYTPNVDSKFETWIKGSYAYIGGHYPLAVQDWKENVPLKYTLIEMQDAEFPHWDIAAVRVSQTEEVIKNAYVDGLEVKVTFKDGSISIMPLSTLINEKNSPFSTQLLLLEENPRLILEWISKKTNRKEKVYIPLHGASALETINNDSSWQLSPLFEVTLKRKKPRLLLIDNELNDETLLLAFDVYGRIHNQSFKNHSLDSLIAYEKGFGGYFVQTKLPLSQFNADVAKKKEARHNFFVEELQKVLSSKIDLSPPLQAFKMAAEKVNADFAESFLDFLIHWNKTDHLLFSTNQPLSANLEAILHELNWDLFSLKDRQIALWATLLFDHLEQGRKGGKEIFSYLKEQGWPLSFQLENASLANNNQIQVLTQQLLAVISDLPYLEMSKMDLKEIAKYYSGLLMAYGINYFSLFPLDKPNDRPFEKDDDRLLTFEAPVTQKLVPAQPLIKMEENKPGILLELKKGDKKERIALAYDSSGIGLKWPALSGKYLFRFQPKTHEIPYHIRVRQARTIHYPDSSQPYSYEADVLISNENQISTDITLSMNRVYETWDGYRFYLAGMSTSSESGIHRIQIVVNHDPVKYYLTYPGALLVALGAILLFWFKSYFYGIR